jgi:hypothetical protein
MSWPIAFEDKMAKSTKVYDVFISHATADSELARQVVEACRESGLAAAMNAELLPGRNPGDAVWDALAESRALITILSSQGPTPAMAIEIGAARAWNKPIYAVVTDPSADYTGVALKGVPRYTAGRLADVIRAIKVGIQEFSEDDSLVLARLYSETTATVDQLALDARQLARLAGSFARASGKRIDGDRLLSELLRMRKQRKLVRRRPAGRATS